MNNFKKIVAVFLTILILVTLLPAQVLAANNDILIVKIGSPWMIVNGIKKEIDPGRNTIPQTVKDRTLVPVRAIVEEMGGTVGWEQSTKKIDISLASINITLWLDKKEAVINGKKITMDVPPMVINSRTMIPLRFVAENLGADVEWNNSTKEATISFNKQKGGGASLNIEGWEYIVINSVKVAKSDFVIKGDDDMVDIYISTEKLDIALRYPPLLINAMANSYPKIRVNNDNINIYWEDEGSVLLEVNMTKGSPIAYITMETMDGQEAVDMGAKPFDRDGKTFIPIALFLTLFEMELSESEDPTIVFMQFENSFDQSKLIGSWSNTHTDLYTWFSDIPGGIGGLSSYESGYIFNKDGSFKYVGISVGGFQDKFVMQKGKYYIIGNTIMFYDRLETFYSGRPFSLQYKDRKLKEDSYTYINGFLRSESEDKIKIDGDWYYLVK